MVLLRDGSNCVRPSRLRRAASCYYCRSVQTPTRLQCTFTTLTDLPKSHPGSKWKSVLHCWATHQLLGSHDKCSSSVQLLKTSQGHSSQILKSGHNVTRSDLLRDHRLLPGQQPFLKHQSRLCVRAGTPSGAGGQAAPRSRQRGGLPFKPASSQPQPASQSKPQAERPAKDQTAASQPVAKQQSSVSKQHAALRKAARSRQIGSDTCQVCGGRGFQIVEEVCPASSFLFDLCKPCQLTTCMSMAPCRQYTELLSVCHISQACKDARLCMPVHSFPQSLPVLAHSTSLTAYPNLASLPVSALNTSLTAYTHLVSLPVSAHNTSLTADPHLAMPCSTRQQSTRTLHNS